MRHLLDERNKGVFESPIPLSITFKDAKKFDVQNPVIGNIMSQVYANQLTDAQVKKLLSEGEEAKIRLRLGALRNNGGGGDGGDNPPPLSLPPLPPIPRFPSPPLRPPLLEPENNVDTNDAADVDMDFLDNLTSRPEPRFETDFNRPLTSVIDNANNAIEMVPRAKEKTKQKADINLSEQLAKLFPDVDKKITDKNDQSINQLRLSDLSEILSKIDKGEVPKQLEFFEGGISREFETNVRSIGLSSDSTEFLDFL